GGRSPAAAPAAARGSVAESCDLPTAPPLRPAAARPSEAKSCPSAIASPQPPPRYYINIYGSVMVTSHHDLYQRFLIIRWAAPLVPAKAGWHARCWGPSIS